ncbi:MAG: hypothetical protein M1839_000465 [Geoglossum umbratile]|nr:MAG: hypothetical protein M1839_000465 [Geoglossum umbratile]
MAFANQYLNTTNVSEIPILTFSPTPTANSIRKRWTEPLLVHARASEMLREDLVVFTRGLYSQTALASQFLLATRHHMHILLEPTLHQIKAGLQGYLDVQASEQFLKGAIPSIGSLIELAGETLASLRDTRGLMMDQLGLANVAYVVTPGHPVPTASPRQLLISLLLNHPVILEKLRKDGDVVLADIGKHLKLPSIPFLDKKEYQLRRDVADGTPKMFFACYHIKGGQQELFVGSNQADWGALSAIGDIRRADRNERIRTYIPLASKAFVALQEAERDVNLPKSMESLEPMAKLYQTRMRAIAAMKGTPHPDFLGRTAETGQAFNRAMEPAQCCYFCQGMMGYRVPAKFIEKDVRSYICYVDWRLRNGYAHSCAEIEVSLQCCQNWVGKGKPGNS